MIAIVVNDQANIVAIISILLSMTSVTTKALLFSRSINKKVFLFNWLCVSADFFGIFFVISWIFYNHNGTSNDTDSIFDNFNHFGKIWMYQFMYVLLPVIIGICSSLFAMIYAAMFDEEKCCARIFWSIVLTLVYVCGTAFCMILFEIINYIIIAFILSKTIDWKIPSYVLFLYTYIHFCVNIIYSCNIDT